MAWLLAVRVHAPGSRRCTLLKRLRVSRGWPSLGVAGPAAEGMEALVSTILAHATLPQHDDKSVPLLFAVDHCFGIRGQGTVLTGTVLQGRVAVGQTVELPALRLEKKVKSMQMFRRPVTEAHRGDRVGICFAQLDAGLMERGLVAEPGSVPTVSSAVRLGWCIPDASRAADACCARHRGAPAPPQVAAVEKIRFFKGAVPSKARFHVTLGYVTVMAHVVFFGGPAGATAAAAAQSIAAPGPSLAERAASFRFDCEYSFQEELLGVRRAVPKGGAMRDTDTRVAFPAHG